MVNKNNILKKTIEKQEDLAKHNREVMEFICNPYDPAPVYKSKRKEKGGKKKLRI